MPLLGYIVVGFWLVFLLFFWFIVYGASLYDRRSKPSVRHRADQTFFAIVSHEEELDEALNNLEKSITSGE